MGNSNGTAELVFALMLTCTFAAAIIARRHSARDNGDPLAGRHLNRWLIGLSAGTTANSGFIVTAAVGLGYTFGLQWILLPVSWMLGDCVFWFFFPARINRFGHETHATTLSGLLSYGLKGRAVSVLAVLAAFVILVCLAGYTSAQWLAGQKFLAGAFGLPKLAALGIFAALIVSYSSIGGFRGSVYTDTLQAFIRIIGTIIALVAVCWFAFVDQGLFSHNIVSAGRSFLSPFPGGFAITCGFVIGFVAAAIGFGLGQPQIVSRYLAGRSPVETRAAWWIYIAFVQGTWIGMTVFGIVLRGVMPGIADPEAGLSVFFQQGLGPILTGVLAADVFATIASTSNGLLVAMAQVVKFDLISKIPSIRNLRLPLASITLSVGVMTMLISLVIHGTVVTVALASVSMMGAALASAVMIKVIGWPHTGISLLYTMIVGLLAAAAWRYFELNAFVNEAAIGIVSGLITNWILVQFTDRQLISAAPQN